MEYEHEDYPPPSHSYFATSSHQSSYQENEVIISDECYFLNLNYDNFPRMLGQDTRNIRN